jgi:hypothetical protein
MGMFRDGSNEIDIVKEMAEGLGSTGLKLEDLLEQIQHTHERVQQLLDTTDKSKGMGSDYGIVNESIRKYNSLIDQAEDALRWLLIQREACGFRTHKNVNKFYPIPLKMRLIPHE